jgi:hypothetical protein
MTTASIAIAGWIALYFGFGVLRASGSYAETSSGRGRAGKLLKLPGYGLIAIGAGSLIFCLVRHWL